MRSVGRLIWRVGGFEVKAAIVTAVALAAVTGGLSLFLWQVMPAASCAASGPSIGRCDTALYDDLSRRGGQLMVLMAILPVVIACVLGSQLFARDLERGTVQLPWSLTASRGRWFVERAALLGAAASLVLVVPALTAMALESAMNRGVDPARILVDFGLRGPSVIARAVAAFAIAAVIGLAIGRTLPALLVSLVAGFAVAFAVGVLAIAAQPTEYIAPLGNPEVRYGVVRDEAYQDADGRLLTVDEVTAKVPAGTPDPTTWIEGHFRQVAIGVRGERFWDAEAVSSGLSTVVATSAIILGAGIARRRRPFGSF